MLKILRKFIVNQNNKIRIDKIEKIKEVIQLKTIQSIDEKFEN